MESFLKEMRKKNSEKERKDDSSGWGKKKEGAGGRPRTHGFQRGRTAKGEAEKGTVRTGMIQKKPGKRE